jgi:hypothetical protein
MTKQAQTIAMDKVKKKRASSADSMRKTGQAINMLGKKKAASNKTPKSASQGSRRQLPKPPQGSRSSSSKGNGGKFTQPAVVECVKSMEFPEIYDNFLDQNR